MSSINPLELLNSLKELLNEKTGGLQGAEEAIQLSKIMVTFSKKMVCIIVYINILKESTPYLLNIVMDTEVWNLVYNWLKDAVESNNIVLIKDLLKILHNVPETVERLKSNEGPKLVNDLFKTHIDQEVRSLAQRLVKKWCRVITVVEWKNLVNDKECVTTIREKSLKDNSDSNISLHTKKQSSSLLKPAPKPKLPESKTISGKKPYYIHIEKKEHVGEKKPVKILKSRFKSTGLEEKVPTLPPLESKVQSKHLTSLSKAKKRSSSPASNSPNEKKIKSFPLDNKKPPPSIQESSTFMDALLSTINSAREIQRKRKYKKDTTKRANRDSCTPTTPNSQLFCGDTLSNSTTESIDTNKPEEKCDKNLTVDESNIVDERVYKGGLKSILVYVRNKSSKKSVSWKNEVSYFECDETEKVNVKKKFKSIEVHLRDIKRKNDIAEQKLIAAHNMEAKTSYWRNLDDNLFVDISSGKEKIEAESDSEKKERQTLREQCVLPPIYFTKNMVPDSKTELL